MNESRSLVDKLREIQSDCRYEREGALNTFHCYDVTGGYFDQCVEQAEQLEQRYEQIVEVARKMYAALHINEHCSMEFIRDKGDCEQFRNQLEKLGVEV